MNRSGDRSGGSGSGGGGGSGTPKRERRWQTSQERARVAAELIEEAESLTQTGAIASPNDVARDQQPPPIRVVHSVATPVTARLEPESTPPVPGEEATAPAVPAPPPPAGSDDPLYVAAREASERGELERAAASYRDL